MRKRQYQKGTHDSFPAERPIDRNFHRREHIVALPLPLQAFQLGGGAL